MVEELVQEAITEQMGWKTPSEEQADLRTSMVDPVEQGALVGLSRSTTARAEQV